MKSKKEQELYDGFIQEMRRGTIVLAVLSQLKKPEYGYSLVVRLEESGYPIEPGTLYPLLRRLEKQGILSSHWNKSGSKPRKYYQLNDLGLRLYQHLQDYWVDTTSTLKKMMVED